MRQRPWEPGAYSGLRRGGIALLALLAAGSADAQPATQRSSGAALERRFESRRGELHGRIDLERVRRAELLRQLSDARTLAAAPRGRSADAWDFLLDPMVAPRAPVDREPPRQAFDVQLIQIEDGAGKPLIVRELRLDADRDGRPEQVRHLETEHDVLLRKEVDRNLDGAIDEIQIHEAGELRERHLDTDYNGRIDVQEHYRDAVMSFREVDRDQDGVLDGFYVYQQGLLVEERHDTDNDTHPDRVLVYRDRLRVEERVDDDLDGRIDIWRHFDTASGVPVVVRVERDTRGRGWADTFESFDTIAGEPILSRREEDVNGDRHVDVVSLYRQGRLVRREILDPAAADL